MPRKNHRAPAPRSLPIISCGSKQRYSTEKEALAAAEYRMLLQPGLALHAYRCPICHTWHLTSNEAK